MRRFGALAFLSLLAGSAEVAAQTAAARLTINSASGSMGSSSTNTGGSFQLQNLSTGGQKITSVKIDTSTALLPDVVFDPAGTAGDPDGKAFNLDSFSGTGTPVHSFESPHDGVGSGDGYHVLKITFGSSVNFGPGKSMTFSADIDPTSVKGAPGPGPEHSASISGLELIGATVTVTFDDGTTRVVRNGGITGTTNSNKTSVGLLSPGGNLATPGLSVPGKSSPFTTNSQPTVRVTGPAGSSVKLWVFNSALYLAGVPGGGYDIDPYETNKVNAYKATDATIGASGSVDLPVTLASTNGGVNQVAVVLVNSSGKRSSSSDILTIKYTPNGTGTTDTEPPSPPGNLSTNGVSAGSVSLVWSASTDNKAVTGYRVLRDGTQIGTTTQLIFTDGGRTPSTQYAYAVKAFDAAGNESTPALLTLTTAADEQDPVPPGSIQGFAGNGTARLSWNAATDDVGVTGYRIYRDQSLIDTVTTLDFNDTGLVNETTYNYEVTAIDAAGNESVPALVSVTPAEGGGTGVAVLRVNVGSSSPFVDPQGNSWSADFGYNTGSTFSYSNAIQGTTNQKIYQTRRSVGSSQPYLTYAFNLPAGDYRVVLHFVEASASATVGSRVFDIVAEGTLQVDNMDIFARVGTFSASVIEFPVIISDGKLNLEFPRVASNPSLSGIEVFEVLPAASTQSLQAIISTQDLAGQTDGDSDHGGLSDLAESELQLDPNDAADDLSFRLSCARQGQATEISLPVLKPIGNYHLHRATDLGDIGNLANRIDTVTKEEIEAMTPQKRADYRVQDTSGGERAFYQLFFEPVGD